MTVIFDAGPLITVCKFFAQDKIVVDHLIDKCEIIIPPIVEEEVAILGASYPDGIIAGERIASGGIHVVSVICQQLSKYLDNYALGKGEQDAIELCKQLEADVLVIDDNLAFIVATRLGLKTYMLPDLITKLVECHKLEFKIAKDIMEVIRPRYRVGVIDHNLVRLQEVK